MFHQLLTPVAGNLFLSFLVGFIPLIVVLVLLGVVRLPAWQAALSGLVAGLIIAILIWQMPVGLAFNSTLNGIVFAVLPVMWIVWNAMWLYNITVRSGKFDLFRRWMIHNVPADKRILMLIIGFSFGALMEGIAGFGTPVAIGSALLIGLGFPVLRSTGNHAHLRHSPRRIWSTRRPYHHARLRHRLESDATLGDGWTPTPLLRLHPSVLRYDCLHGLS